MALMDAPASILDGYNLFSSTGSSVSEFFTASGLKLRPGCTLVRRHSSSWLQRCVGWNSRHTIDADTTKAWNLSLDEPDAHHNLGLVLEHHILDFLSIFVCQATWPPTISNFSVCPMPFRISPRMHYHLIHGVCQ